MVKQICGYTSSKRKKQIKGFLELNIYRTVIKFEMLVSGKISQSCLPHTVIIIFTSFIVNDSYNSLYTVNFCEQKNP